MAPSLDNSLETPKIEKNFLRHDISLRAPEFIVLVEWKIYPTTRTDDTQPGDNAGPQK